MLESNLTQVVISTMDLLPLLHILIKTVLLISFYGVPYAGDDEEFIDLSNSKLYKRTFTTVEIKSVGDHCMEKLLVAFMNEVLTAISK